ncbi:hypothetical protein C8J57DRAFT_949589, partial [Mycena rebaudengoi]
IGDLPAKYAEVILQMAQPYPGDKSSQIEKRFLIYRTSDTEHVIMDNSTGEDVLIPSGFLENPLFTLGGWYAEKR